MRGRPAILAVAATTILICAVLFAVGPGAGVILAASPTPSEFAADLRSSGQGAGEAGAPVAALWATLAVVGLGVAAAVATLVAIRLMGSEAGGRDRR